MPSRMTERRDSKACELPPLRWRRPTSRCRSGVRPSKSGANGRRAPVTHPTPDGRNTQVNRYVTARDITGRASASAFGTKRSLTRVALLSWGSRESQGAASGGARGRLRRARRLAPFTSGPVAAGVPGHRSRHPVAPDQRRFRPFSRAMALHGPARLPPPPAAPAAGSGTGAAPSGARAKGAYTSRVRQARARSSAESAGRPSPGSLPVRGRTIGTVRRGQEDRRGAAGPLRIEEVERAAAAGQLPVQGLLIQPGGGAGRDEHAHVAVDVDFVCRVRPASQAHPQRPGADVEDQPQARAFG
jgi:hypothetical protein